MAESRKSRTSRVVSVIGGLGGVALFAYARRLEGREQGLFMAAAIGLVLVFVMVIAFVGTQRDSKK